MTDIKTSFEKRLDLIEQDIALLKDAIVLSLKEDLADTKEAFEHTDDSLSNLRIVINQLRTDVTRLKESHMMP